MRFANFAGNKGFRGRGGMNRSSILSVVLVGIFSLTLAVGCAKKPTHEEVVGETGIVTEEGPGLGTESDMEEQVPKPVLELKTIYFDFDRATIRDDMKAPLRANADKILEHAAWGEIIIEGHCDERGSEEYNFALGERRAATVKKYLVALGVPAERLETVSFGESQPAVQGHDESAWRYNRRAEFRSAR